MMIVKTARTGRRMFDLGGQVVVVTGGGGHLGRAITRALTDAGATVVACARGRASLASVEDIAETVVADVTVRADIETVIEHAESLGSLTGWVNNAYAGPDTQPLSLDGNALQKILHVGLTSVMVCTRLARDHMTAGGAIVNIASMYGVVSPRPDVYEHHPEYHNPAAYGAAKAGVIQFSRYAACHYAASGVRVNAVSPGPFPAVDEPDFEEALSKQVPLGRIGAPSEVSGPVVFLLSDAASYVTGHNLVVDGGWTAW